jgi:FeS assembly SUF system protein
MYNFPPSFDESPANELSQPIDDIVADAERMAELKPKILEALATVYDPEIPVNIYELGLIYDVIVDKDGRTGIRMTLTAPACPAAQSLPVEVRQKVAAIDGVSEARVEIVWDPPWTKDRMSEAAKLQLGLW